MERIPMSPPTIAPIEGKNPRPLWSVMIPVFNCSRFIPDVLESVLCQDFGEDQMQIEVVDDGSTDADVEGLVKRIGKGRVKYFRQPKNVGSLRNFETCINRSKGHLVHILHGDDRVLKGYYKTFTEVFQKFPEAGAVFCGYSAIDENGNKIMDSRLVQNSCDLVDQVYHKMAAGLPVQYATMVVKRDVYEKLGSFFGVIAGEDWEMWTRVAKNYPIAYIPEILSEYRRYIGTISWPKISDGKYAKCLAETTFLIESQLPEKDKHIMKKTRKRRAISCINTSSFIWKQSQDLKSINELTVIVLRLNNTSIEIYKRLIRLYSRILFHSIFIKLRKLPILYVAIVKGRNYQNF